MHWNDGAGKAGETDTAAASAKARPAAEDHRWNPYCKTHECRWHPAAEGAPAPHGVNQLHFPQRSKWVCCFCTAAHDSLRRGAVRIGAGQLWHDGPEPPSIIAWYKRGARDRRQLYDQSRVFETLITDELPAFVSNYVTHWLLAAEHPTVIA